jgi:serine/threonine-protein kinase HipA
VVATELSPIAMPLGDRVYRFPALARETFHGLPGLLADSLPDRFGHALIDACLATEGRTPDSFSVVERLCYIGARGMGALEFRPTLGPGPRKATSIEIDALVRLASEVLTHRADQQARFDEAERGKALRDILRVGWAGAPARVD